MVGRIPTYSSPRMATRETADPSAISCFGAPSIGRSRPFLIFIICNRTTLIEILFCMTAENPAYQHAKAYYF
ncbi:hypothetical protein AOR13_52 [Alteromonas stellipolaris LMG 21856]|nr:hypothetical protein AOR13_52 [Alteromonas stellipolaris LMG 21856]